MKKLSATLFILGIPWLLIVVPIIISPINIFMPEHYYKMNDTITTLALAVCGVVGIVVWFGYRLRWKVDGFIWLTKKQFWTLSIIHHTAWLLLIPWSFLSNNGDSYWKEVVDFWLANGSNVYGIWIIFSLFVSIFALIYDSDKIEIKLAEQAAPSNR